MNWLKQLKFIAEKTDLQEDEKILVEKGEKHWLYSHPEDYEGAEVAAKGTLVAYHLNLMDTDYIKSLEDDELIDEEMLKEILLDCSAEGSEFVLPYRQHGIKFALGFMKYKNEEDAFAVAFPEGEKPTSEYCYRMFENDEEAPIEYDEDECVDCTYFECIYMPLGSKEKFNREELDSMFPNGFEGKYDD